MAMSDKRKARQVTCADASVTFTTTTEPERRMPTVKPLDVWRRIIRAK